MDCYSPESMYAYLKELAIEGELTLEEISTIKTIKRQIGRYSANFKKEASEKTLVENMENYQSATVAKGSISQKRPKKHVKNLYQIFC